ncbi:GNAT family N-acetyltransferase [Phytomonospora endophytica]|uniref:GNAT superfamily N-acetyltransferase n=1 Tax=Phytomonospora endophytica TaxID=714109 RepID=A0A841G494_9ACTN|nr:GNAT family N-acetyltransferase [Phytomonospora endophytica]MBB6038930.1 GNAT superfamily N-acetyltransferase [Phytomonospora endophytica]GIG67968.1 N-acetyltransferase GCN5 [Phytomonospora endophytica]
MGAVVQRIPAGRTHAAFRAMRELRPALTTAEDFGALVDGELRPGGYLLAGVFTDDTPDAVAVAGYRYTRSLAAGAHLYVDDLVSLPEVRGRGHARELLAWLVEEAKTHGCAQLHLDSGTHRHGAHGFYFANGLHVSAFHFMRELG